MLPSLQQLDSKDIRRTGAPKLNDAVTSSEVYQLCRRQLSEQDGMRERHLQELEGSEEAASPEKIAHLCNLKVAICSVIGYCIMLDLSSYVCLPSLPS